MRSSLRLGRGGRSFRPGRWANSEVGHHEHGRRPGRLLGPHAHRQEHPGRRAVRDVRAACGVRWTAASTGSTRSTSSACSDGGVHSSQRASARARRDGGAARRVLACSSTSSPTAATRRRPAASATCRQLQDAMIVAATGRDRDGLAGRYYAMDRDKRWERTKLGLRRDRQRHRANRRRSRRSQAIQASHDAGVTDEFIKPIVVVGRRRQARSGPIRDGDSVDRSSTSAPIAHGQIIARARARATSTASRGPIAAARRADDDDGIRPDIQRSRSCYTPQTFSSNLAGRARRAQPHRTCGWPRRRIRARHALLQLRPRGVASRARIASSCPSQKVRDLRPACREMSAPGIADELVADAPGGSHQVVICNFANADMVGHTGSLEAAIAAVETPGPVPRRRSIPALHAAGGTRHRHRRPRQRRADVGRRAQGAAHGATRPTPVPVILYDDARVGMPLRERIVEGRHPPTILALLGIAKSAEMTGTPCPRSDDRSAQQRPRERSRSGARAAAAAWFVALGPCSFRISSSCRLDTRHPGAGAGDNLSFLWNSWWARDTLASNWRLPVRILPHDRTSCSARGAARPSIRTRRWRASRRAVRCRVRLSRARTPWSRSRVSPPTASRPTGSPSLYLFAAALPSILAGDSAFATRASRACIPLGHVNLTHAWVLPVAAAAWTSFVARPSSSRASGVRLSAFAILACSDYYFTRLRRPLRAWSGWL
mgnify:CR=1 FL=1